MDVPSELDMRKVTGAINVLGVPGGSDMVEGYGVPHRRGLARACRAGKEWRAEGGWRLKNFGLGIQEACGIVRPDGLHGHAKEAWRAEGDRYHCGFWRV